MKILAVDDDDIALALLRKALIDAGYDVATFAAGEEALCFMRSEPVRFVITDWEMPGMDGLAVCRAIRREFGGGVHLVLLTSHDTPEAIQAGRAAGANTFLIKPFDRTELVARAREAEWVAFGESVAM